LLFTNIFLCEYIPRVVVVVDVVVVVVVVDVVVVVVVVLVVGFEEFYKIDKNLSCLNNLLNSGFMAFSIFII
jgi:hypothetical protein